MSVLVGMGLVGLGSFRRGASASVLLVGTLVALAGCGGPARPAAKVPPPEYEEVELPPYQAPRVEDPLDNLDSLRPKTPDASEESPSPPAAHLNATEPSATTPSATESVATRPNEAAPNEANPSEANRAEANPSAATPSASEPSPTAPKSPDFR